jgi:hypothetical protein
MSYPINYPTPQGADIQMFSQGGSTSDWTKPQGASFVWFTLIGGGGGGACGDGGSEGGGGGSAAVTNFMCPAFLIPDVLRVSVARGGLGGNSGTAEIGGTTSIIYQQKDGTGYTLLTAAGGFGLTRGNPTGTASGGAAMTANFFTAMGFFQSIAGQDYTYSGTPPASSTTFTSAGAAGTIILVTANYGYTNNSGGGSGFFQTQPIIVSCGGAGSPSTSLAVGGAGGVGSGGGGGYIDTSDNRRAKGGDGLVVIITW